MPANDAGDRSNPVRVMMIGRESYALRMVVAVRSLIDNLGPGRSLELKIVEEGITDATKQRLMRSWDLSRTSIEWVNVRRGGGLTLLRIRDLPAVYVARLFCAKYVPEEWSRLIFLDPDVMVLTDITRLWGEALGGRAALATRDPFAPTLSHPDGLSQWRAAGLPADAPYFSAAVMLIDLHQWRSERTLRAAAEFIERFGRSIRFGDQDVLNAILSGRWGELDPRWQVHPRMAQRPRLARRLLDDDAFEKISTDPWIYHFGGRLKPWDYRGSHRADELFYEYLDRTDWRGWRPPRTLRSVLYRFYDSPLRDWLHPLEVRAGAVLRVAVNLLRR